MVLDQEADRPDLDPVARPDAAAAPDAPAGAPDTGENLDPSEMTVEATIEVGFGIL